MCGSEVENLPVILERRREGEDGTVDAAANGGAAAADAAVLPRRYRDVPMVFVAAAVAYFCFFEQMLVGLRGSPVSRLGILAFPLKMHRVLLQLLDLSLICCRFAESRLTPRPAVCLRLRLCSSSAAANIQKPSHLLWCHRARPGASICVRRFSSPFQAACLVSRSATCLPRSVSKRPAVAFFYQRSFETLRRMCPDILLPLPGVATREGGGVNFDPRGPHPGRPDNVHCSQDGFEQAVGAGSDAVSFRGRRGATHVLLGESLHWKSAPFIILSVRS